MKTFISDPVYTLQKNTNKFKSIYIFTVCRLTHKFTAENYSYLRLDYNKLSIKSDLFLNQPSINKLIFCH